MFNKECICW